MFDASYLQYVQTPPVEPQPGFTATLFQPHHLHIFEEYTARTWSWYWPGFVVAICIASIYAPVPRRLKRPGRWRTCAQSDPFLAHAQRDVSRVSDMERSYLALACAAMLISEDHPPMGGIPVLGGSPPPGILPAAASIIAAIVEMLAISELRSSICSSR